MAWFASIRSKKAFEPKFSRFLLKHVEVAKAPAFVQHGALVGLFPHPRYGQALKHLGAIKQVVQNDEGPQSNECLDLAPVEQEH